MEGFVHFFLAEDKFIMMNLNLIPLTKLYDVGLENI